MKKSCPVWPRCSGRSGGCFYQQIDCGPCSRKQFTLIFSEEEFLVEVWFLHKN